jgi:hypothetical protein
MFIQKQEHEETEISIFLKIEIKKNTHKNVFFFSLSQKFHVKRRAQRWSNRAETVEQRLAK